MSCVYKAIFLRRIKLHMAAKKRRKNMPFTLQQYAIKLSVMACTTVIGLWCGWHDSFSAFYIASLMQAINNMHDSFEFLKGYNRFITFFQFLAFIGALTTAILSIIHFAPNGDYVDTKFCLILISVCLSIPILHFSVEALLILHNDLY